MEKHTRRHDDLPPGAAECYSIAEADYGSDQAASFS
jgi:hypothetical protein